MVSFNIEVQITVEEFFLETNCKTLAAYLN